jgi:hypothetical protein
MTGRRLGAAGFGAFVAFWLARALFKWILDMNGDAYWALVAAFVVVGATIGVASQLAEERKSSGPPSA